MVKDNNYSLEQIKKNLLLFEKKIKEKKMEGGFWIIADRADFKPLRKIIKNKINSKKSSKTNSKKSSKTNSKKSSKTNSKKSSKKQSKKSSKKQSKKSSKTNSKTSLPIIHSIKELKDNFLDGRSEYYKDKQFANIKVTLNDKVLDSLDNIREYKNIADETLLTVQITIFKVSSTGYLNFADKTELKVKYTCEDFRKFHFKLKNLEVLMRLVADSVIKTNSSNGISYKNLLEKINKNK
jgi:hypothetical protein